MSIFSNIKKEFPDFKFQFDNQTEKFFRKDYIEKSLVVMRVGYFLGIFLYSVFGLLDIWIVPETKHIAWFFRFAIAIPVMVFIIVISFHNIFKKHSQLFLIISSIIMGLAIVGMIAYSHPTELGYKYYYTGLILVLIWVYTFVRLRFWNSLISGLSITIGYEIIAIFVQHLADKGMGSENMLVLINNNFFFISANIVGIFASFHIEKLHRLDFLQKQIIKDENIRVVHYSNMLQQKNEEIVVQRDEIGAQRNILSEQNYLLQEQKQMITDSINYAKKIQQAVLPTKEFVDEILGDYFIYFKPKDIVSGDYYWVSKVNEYIIIAVADCTGHGVPGGFMSMLGASYLKEIIKRSDITQANQVLNEMRSQIVDSLQQRGLSGEQKDGMDMAIVVINTNNDEIQYSGANNPLYIVKSHAYRQAGEKIKVKSEKIKDEGDELSNLDFQLYEIKPDKMPVAIYENMDPFTNHIIKIKKGDIIYLASDGYEDQFGGPYGKKYLSKKLKELLVNNSDKLMSEQLKIIDESIEDWKNNYGRKYEQTDDITILGIKIS